MYALGAVAEEQAQLTRLQQTLHQLALSIQAATATGQADAAAALRTQWQVVKAQTDALVKQLYGADMPSGLALTVADLGTQVATVFRGLGLGAGVALAGIGVVLLLPMLRGRR